MTKDLRFLPLAATLTLVLLVTGCPRPQPASEDAGETTTDSGTAQDGGERHPVTPPSTTTDGGTAVTIISVTADTEARSDAPETNYGTALSFATSATPERVSYLRFDVKGVVGTVTSAVLRCHVNETSGNGPALHASPDGWDELTLTWNNRPAPSDPIIDDLAETASGTDADFDLTDVVTADGLYDFALVPSNGETFACASRESNTPPVLIITSELPQYDLVVSDLSWTPATPQVGDSVLFSAVLTNAGSLATPNGVPHTVHFFIDDANIAQSWNVQHTASMAPGESITLTAQGGQGGVKEWTADAGVHRIRAVADRQGQLQAEDETNNALERLLSVGAPRYDLVVTDVSWTPPAPVAGDSVSFSATIKNIGNGPTPDGTVHRVNFYLDGGTNAVEWSDNYVTPGLDPGQSVVLTANAGTPSAQWTAVTGQYSVAAVVDPDDVLNQELSETNNRRTEPMTVTAAPTGTCNLDPTLPGDTLPCTNTQFPTAAFNNNGANPLGRVIDVTDFGADGSDNLDDTNAIVAAYDKIINDLQTVGWNGFFQNNNKASYILYFPNGTYRVSRTIIYSGVTRYVKNASGQNIKTAEALAQIRFIGQSRERTTIELAPGTFTSGENAVLSFGKEDFNNVPAVNSVRNLTIRIKPNNAGAVGIRFAGANAASIENVSIIAEQNSGNIGIDNVIGTVIGPQRNITIDGFDYGVRMLPYHFTHPVLEHVTLKNQRSAGILLVNGTASMRAIKSVNSVPAVMATAGGAHGVILDSALTGGAAGRGAMELTGGSHLFSRNVTVSGYGCGVKKGTACVQQGNVNEYVSDAPIVRSATRPGTAMSLDLPIEEPPATVWNPDPVTEWVKPAYTLADANNSVDATAVIQTAMNSGKPTVYFPAHNYEINGTVTIPCSVRRVEGLFTRFTGTGSPKFRVAQNCTTPLFFQDASFDMFGNGGLAFEHAGLRTLVLSMIQTRAFLYETNLTVAPGGPVPKLFGYMVGNIKAQRPFKNVQAWLRMGSGESPAGTYVVDGANAKVWVMGFKTEKAQPAFKVQNGGTLEVLGGIINQYMQGGSTAPWDDPANIAIHIVGASSKLSFVACTNGPSAGPTGDGFRQVIVDDALPTTATWLWNSPALPVRNGRDHQEIIPLYVSY